MPSGLKWARYNLGANKPEDYGLYFSWGNTVGHSLTEGYNFSQENYSQSEGAAVNADITSANDAATVIKGEKWRTPTSGECTELIENCNVLKTTLNGIAGYLLTSKLNGQVLFIPAGGDFVNTSNGSLGASTYLWSASFSSLSNCVKTNLIAVNNSPRYFGMNIRPVFDENQNRSVIPPSPEDNL